MAEQFPTDNELNALSGTTDAEQEVIFPSIYESPYYTTFYKMLYRLLDVARRAGDLRVYKDGDLTFGVRSGMFHNGDTLVSYSATVGESLTDNAVNSIYLTADGTLQISVTGFPAPSATPHIPLAVIATGTESAAGISGQYDLDDISDVRGRSFMQLINGLAPALANEAGTFFAATDISGAEAETLTDGSNGDSLHVHTLDSGISDVTATAAQLNETGTFFAATDISGAEAETLTDGSNADALHVHSPASGTVEDVATKAFGAIKMTAQANDADYVEIGLRVYEFDPAGDGIPGGDVEVDTNGNTTIDEDITDLAAAINGDGSAVVDAVADTTNDIVWLYAKTAGSAGNTITLAESTGGSRIKVSDSTLTGGSDQATTEQTTFEHTVTTNDADFGVIRINTGLAAISAIFLQHRTSAGAIDNDITVNQSAGVVTITESATNAWTAGDIISVQVTGTAS